MADQLDQRPRRGPGTGVVPGEHQRDEHPGDLVGGEPRLAVLVLDRHQHVEHIAVGLVLGRVGQPLVHDLLHQRNEFHPRLVASFEALDRQVGIDVAQRVGAAFQVVVVLGEPVVELLAELQPDQARRRGVDGQLGEEVEQLDLALVPPVGDHLLDLALDGAGVALHLLAAQRRVVQHLLAPLGAGVEHHALAEDRRHERIRLGLVEILVGGAEEELVGLGAREQDDVLVHQLEPADVAALVAHALHQTDWVGAEFLEVAVLFLAAGNPGHHSAGRHCPGIPSSPSASFWRSLLSANGASG